MGSEIIVCGRRFDIDHQVVTFEEADGYSAYVPHCTDDISRIYATHPAPGLAHRATRYSARRLMGGSSRLELLRQVVRKVTVHLDGCLSASQCFNVLHNQRGLSVHFMVDNDGTIYQTLDLMHCAFHAAGVNEVAIGIELQHRGAAARAMANMGLSELYLVSPKAPPYDQRARRRAAQADPLLKSARVVDDLRDALDGVHWVVGTSGRGGMYRYAITIDPPTMSATLKAS